MASAFRQADGQYQAVPPGLVGDLSTLMARLKAMAGPGNTVFVGFDFPIGLPLAYARKTGIKDFLTILPQLGQGAWVEFYRPAETPGQIHIHRPFYPLRSGSARQSHLVSGLGMASMDDLRRQCELPWSAGGLSRRAACPLFWTLGGQQVGKAAITGWRDVLAPALQQQEALSIWPFSGRLEQLLSHPIDGHANRVVIAETYPAEFYTHFGVTFSNHKRGSKSGKRVQADRKTNAPRLLNWAMEAGVHLDSALQSQIGDGFGPSSSGDDAFDATIGLFGMLNILLGRRDPFEPPEGPRRDIEGGILGAPLPR